jgi:predicted DNA-binding protein
MRTDTKRNTRVSMTQYHLNMPDELRDRLEDAAYSAHMTSAEFTRQAIEAACQKQEKGAKK